MSIAKELSEALQTIPGLDEREEKQAHLEAIVAAVAALEERLARLETDGK